MRGWRHRFAAAELARAMRIKVYTIGAGTTGLAPVRVEDPRTGRSALRAVSVEVDEGMLADIADRTGGQFFRANNADALIRVYEQIDRLERTRISEDRFRQYDELFAIPLALGLVLVVAGWLTRVAVFARLP